MSLAEVPISELAGACGEWVHVCTMELDGSNMLRYLGVCGLFPLSGSGQVSLVDKDVAICTSTKHILVIKGSGNMCDSTIVVVMHGEGPVGVQRGQGVGRGDWVDTHRPI